MDTKKNVSQRSTDEDDKNQRTVVIFLSSTRPKSVRQADNVLKLVREEVEACGMKPIVFDPLNMNFEILQKPLHFLPHPDLAPGWLKEANSQLETADAFLMITAEYNSCVPPALVNMLDHFPPLSFRHRPCAIVSYSVGGWGGIRAQTLLPTMTIELGMLNLPRHVNIPNAKEVFSENGECINSKVVADVSRLVQQLDWFAEAIRNKRKTAAPPS